MLLDEDDELDEIDKMLNLQVSLETDEVDVIQILLENMNVLLDEDEEELVAEAIAVHLDEYDDDEPEDLQVVTDVMLRAIDDEVDDIDDDIDDIVDELDVNDLSL